MTSTDTSAAELRSGKGHHDENFPVASWLIHPRHRAPILAFYEFVRVADDIADHPLLPAAEKLSLRRACAPRSQSVASRRATHRTFSPRSAWT